MKSTPIQSIVIVGGGTAGWMSAAFLARLALPGCRITVVESDDIATIGVGEATIPYIATFNEYLGLDEDDFLRNTQGTFKLGIEFVNWGQIGESYMHGFSPIGSELDHVNCYQYWLKMHQMGQAPDLGEFSVGVVAAKNAKFMRRRPEMTSSPLSHVFNAFHFDAGLYAKYLRRYAEARGVLHQEGKIVQTRLRERDGFIDAVVLESGQAIGGDLFIDCSGMRALLLGQALGVEFDDWSRWLPCNRAIAVPCESARPLLPYTRATAHSAGWQWRIPLQHRIGNGHVYSSEFMGQDEAMSTLMNNLDGKALAEPRCIAFVPGRRKTTWIKNCVAVGLSSGFFEPIESTNIHLIQTAIQRVATLLPGMDFWQPDIDEYNRQTQFEYERIRDFIVLHYKLTRRDDSPFWNHCRRMEIPDTLQHKMDLFSSAGRVYREGAELFTEVSWVQVMYGQGLRPQSYNPLVDKRSESEIGLYLGNVASVIRKCCDLMPTHEEYVAQHCAARQG
jgi:tryptophan halogenase